MSVSIIYATANRLNTFFRFNEDLRANTGALLNDQPIARLEPELYWRRGGLGTPADLVIEPNAFDTPGG